MPALSDDVTTPPAVDALVQLSFAVHLTLTRVAASHHLSVTQLRLLGILRDRTPTMAQIATFLELDRSSVSGLVDRAERRGLVVRRTSGTDARVTMVELTDSGFAIGADVARDMAAALQATTDRITDADLNVLERIVHYWAENPSEARARTVLAPDT